MNCNQRSWGFDWGCIKLCLHGVTLTLKDPFISESCIEIKI